MISRTPEHTLRELAGYYPAVAVTGPRQSGKATLCRMVYPDKPCVSREALDVRVLSWRHLERLSQASS